MTQRRRVKLDDSGMPVHKADVPAEEPAEAPEPCDCPVLDHDEWDGVESDWSDITFVKGVSSAVLGVPVGYDKVRDELRRRAVELGGTVPEDAMLLNGEGKFRRPIMLEVEGVAEQAGVIRPGGVVFTRLIEAPLGAMGKAVDQTNREAKAKYGRTPDDTWVWYLTCRHCSRARNFETLIVAHYRSRG